MAAVAAHKEGFTTLVELLPGLAFHAVALLAGMVCLGLSQRPSKKYAPNKNVVVPIQ